MQKILLSAIIALLVGAGGGFYAGIKYQQSKSLSQGNFAVLRQQFNGGNGAVMRRNGNSGFTTGQIINRDDKSVTVKTADGGSKIIFYSGSTAIGKTTPGTPEDLTVGEEIVAFGASNPDGSITANNIQIRPPGATPFSNGR